MFPHIVYTNHEARERPGFTLAAALRRHDRLEGPGLRPGVL